MRVIFADKTAPVAGSSERVINLYGVAGPEGGRSRVFLRAMPGTRDWASAPGVLLRAFAEIGGALYSVSAAVLVRTSDGASQSTLGAVAADDARTTLAGYRDYVGVCSGGVYQLWDGAAQTITQPAGGRLATVGSIAYANGYILLADGREVEWAERGAPGTRNGTYFAEAEGRDDGIVRIVASGAYLWVLKERSHEVWSTTGAAGRRAWDRLPGMVRQRGLRAFGAVCRTPTGLFLIGDDRKAYASAGLELAVVSSPQVEEVLATHEPASCFYYEWRGAQFANVAFGDRPTLVCDLSTGRWWERAHGPEHEPWPAAFAANCYGEWRLATRTCAIYRMGPGTHDADAALRRTMVSRTLRPGERFRVPFLEIEGTWGEGSVTQPGDNSLRDVYGFPLTDADGRRLYPYPEPPVGTDDRPAMAWLRTSRDGGQTWGAPKVREIGARGQRSATCRFRSLGLFRQFTAEFNISDPVDVTLFGEYELVAS
jgi:hypothetical protein